MSNCLLRLALVTALAVFASGAKAFDFASAQTRPSAGEAADLYRTLLAKDVRERARMLEQMPSATKSAVWTEHFLIALVDHPEFTDQQRAIIQDALRLLTPDFFAIDASDPQWAELVDEPLRQLTRRAKEAFLPKLGRELFVQLGPDGPPARTIAERIAGTNAMSLPKPIHPTIEYCTCSPSSDWCEFQFGIPGMKCSGGGCYWTTTGCGTLFRYACTANCVYTGGG